MLVERRKNQNAVSSAQRYMYVRCFELISFTNFYYLLLLFRAYTIGLSTDDPNDTNTPFQPSQALDLFVRRASIKLRVVCNVDHILKGWAVYNYSGSVLHHAAPR